MAADKKDPLYFVVANRFLPEFCDIKVTPRVKQKLRGIDGNGKPIDFTPAEKMLIQDGLMKMAKEFSK